MTCVVLVLTPLMWTISVNPKYLISYQTDLANKTTSPIKTVCGYPTSGLISEALLDSLCCLQM